MDLVTRLFGSRRILVPVAVGAVALLIGGLFAYITIRDTGDGSETTSASEVETRAVISRKGGYAVDVPRDLRIERTGRTTRFTAKDKSLVVTVGPGESGRLKPASRRFLGSLTQGYRNVRVLAVESEQIDGRPARISFGQARNAQQVRLRFVAAMVRHRPQNYTITAFTAFNSDPEVVLPRVNAIVNSFEVRERKR